MGTRADFYVGRGAMAEWLGSIGWDGYPEGIDKEVFEASTEAQFRERVEKFFASREDATRPEQGWPWPWNDSGTSDYAYAFDGGKVHTHGSEWSDGAPTVFPDMSSRKNVTMGKRSGLMVFGIQKT